MNTPPPPPNEAPTTTRRTLRQIEAGRVTVILRETTMGLGVYIATTPGVGGRYIYNDALCIATSRAGTKAVIEALLKVVDGWPE